jgi:nitrogen-specific signal transduction histidine kinase
MTDYDLLPCSIFISDRSFNITYCNQQFAAEMNRSVNGIIHHKLERLLTNGSKILFQQIVFPSILNQHKISEVQLNFLDSSNNKIPWWCLRGGKVRAVKIYSGAALQR